MKKIFLTLILLSATKSFAQISIGKETVEGSGLIDFQEDSNLGIVLPWISTVDDSQFSKGTFIYNTQLKKVMFYDGNQWKDLSAKEGDISDKTAMLAEQNSLTETEGGILLGDDTFPIHGVLILNSNDKALILPKMEQPWQNIKNPEPGTMAYDTTNDLLCVFNGSEWTFWGL